MFKLLRFYSKRFTGCAPEIVHLPRHCVIWTAMRGLLLCIPTALIGYVSVDFKGSAPVAQTKLVTFLAKNEPVFILIILAPFLATALLEMWERWTARVGPAHEPHANEFPAILKGIDNAIAPKATAAAEYAAEVLKSRGRRSDALVHLCQPGEQIEEMVAQLYYVLRNITGDSEIKVVLVRVVEGIPQPNAVFMPKDCVPSGNLLKENPRKTMFYFAAHQNRVKVISDIERYLELTPKKDWEYWPSGTDDDKGSIICIPVVHPYWDEVFYVISFKSDTTGIFTRSGKNRFKRISQYFTKRILIEHVHSIVLDHTDP